MGVGGIPKMFGSISNERSVKVFLRPRGETQIVLVVCIKNKTNPRQVTVNEEDWDLSQLLIFVPNIPEY